MSKVPTPMGGYHTTGYAQEVVVPPERTGPVEHELKCWPQYFEEIYLGRKTFEVRLNDRDYRMLDVLRIREFNPVAAELASEYSGREIRKRIGYILHGNPAVVGMEAAHAGISPGYVILSLIPTAEDHAGRRDAAQELLALRRERDGLPGLGIGIAPGGGATR